MFEEYLYVLLNEVVAGLTLLTIFLAFFGLDETQKQHQRHADIGIRIWQAKRRAFLYAYSGHQ